MSKFVMSGSSTSTKLVRILCDNDTNLIYLNYLNPLEKYNE